MKEVRQSNRFLMGIQWRKCFGTKRSRGKLYAQIYITNLLLIYVYFTYNHLPMMTGVVRNVQIHGLSGRGDQSVCLP